MLTPEQQRWVERRYDEVCSTDWRDFVWGALVRQVEAMPEPELTERLRLMDEENA